MKKAITIVLFIGTFSIYNIYQLLNNVQKTPVEMVVPALPQEEVLVPVQPVAPKVARTPAQPVQTKQPKPVPSPVPAPVVPPAPALPVSKPKGQYADGVYAGSIADAYYGNVQVQAVVKGGALADVVFLQYPSDRGTSRQINNRAMPTLVQEAIQAQSARVNTVSGASELSRAFSKSLSVALAQAKN